MEASNQGILKPKLRKLRIFVILCESPETYTAIFSLWPLATTGIDGIGIDFLKPGISECHQGEDPTGLKCWFGKKRLASLASLWISIAEAGTFKDRKSLLLELP